MVSNPSPGSVSIILATYNCSGLIMRAVNSAMAQTHKNFELVIVDDGSTDYTFDILFPALKENANIKYLRHSNRKHPLSLNAGIRNTEMEYITFLDSDDEYMPEHLKLRVDHMKENPVLDLIYSPATITGDEPAHWVPDAQVHGKLIHIDDCIIGGTLFGKRDVFIKLEGFSDVYSHDSDFVRRASEKFVVEKFDNRTYIYHRDNPESVTSKMRRFENC